MNGRAYFLAYVRKVGGRPAASEKLQIPYPTIAAICNGGRGIGKNMARRIAAASGLSANRLVWTRPIVKRAPRKRRAVA